MDGTDPTPTELTLARFRETIRVVAPALAAAKAKGIPVNLRPSRAIRLIPKPGETPVVTVDKGKGCVRIRVLGAVVEFEKA